MQNCAHCLAARTQPVAGEGNVWRVISGAAANDVRFAPVDVHEAVTLGRGDWIEFATSSDFEVIGGGPLLLVQVLVGQGSSAALLGDPSMVQAVPMEQYRSDYGSAVPDGYRDDAATSMLDDATVVGFHAIGETGYGAAHLPIVGGFHAISDTRPFATMCHGYGVYTSHAYPCGLDARVLPAP